MNPRHQIRFSLVVCQVAVLLAGCQSPAEPDSYSNQMVYYDRGSKQPVVYNISREFPAIHPRTGQATLVPASYCPRCQKWFPSPPIEIRERNPQAAVCPQGHSLTLDGPWPDEEL